jgi:hypothetical protein
MMDSYVIDLNEIPCTGQIECPYCSKGRMYMYNCKGRTSSNCPKCNRLVLWDFDNLKSYKAKARRFVS